MDLKDCHQICKQVYSKHTQLPPGPGLVLISDRGTLISLLLSQTNRVSILFASPSVCLEKREVEDGEGIGGGEGGEGRGEGREEREGKKGREGKERGGIEEETYGEGKGREGREE